MEEWRSRRFLLDLICKKPVDEEEQARSKPSRGQGNCEVSDNRHVDSDVNKTYVE